MRNNQDHYYLLAIFCLIVFGVPGCSLGKPFDSEAWKRGDTVVRGQMVRSLRKGQLLHGKSKSEVIELLGKPDYETAGSWVYRVDMGEKFGNGPWLSNVFIVYGSGGRVERVGLDD